MCLMLRDALRVGNIALSAEFFSSSPSPAEVMLQLEDELRNFCVVVEPPKTPFGKGARAFGLPQNWFQGV